MSISRRILPSAYVALSALAGLYLCTATAAQAATVTVSFDDLPAAYYWPGTLVTGEARLTNQLVRSHGVAFSSSAGFAGVVNLGAGHAVSGAGGLSGTGQAGGVSFSDPITLTFLDPLTQAAGVTDRVSIHTDRWGDGQTVRMQAYDIFGRLLAEDAQADKGNAVLTLSASHIHKVVLWGSNSSAFDELSYSSVTAAAVPEPSSLALGTTGLLVAGLMRRRSACRTKPLA